MAIDQSSRAAQIGSTRANYTGFAPDRDVAMAERTDRSGGPFVVVVVAIVGLLSTIGAAALGVTGRTGA